MNPSMKCAKLTSSIGEKPGRCFTVWTEVDRTHIAQVRFNRFGFEDIWFK